MAREQFSETIDPANQNYQVATWDGLPQLEKWKVATESLKLFTERGEHALASPGSEFPKRRFFRVAALPFEYGTPVSCPAGHRESNGCSQKSTNKASQPVQGVIEPILTEIEKIMANYHLIFTELDTALRSGDEAATRTAEVVFAAVRMEKSCSR